MAARMSLSSSVERQKLFPVSSYKCQHAGGASLTAAAFSANKRSPVLVVASEDGAVAVVALSGLPDTQNSPQEVYAALGITSGNSPLK